jgi:hypothetical protein
MASALPGYTNSEGDALHGTTDAAHRQEVRDEVSAACRDLSEMMAVEALPDLVELLDFHVSESGLVRSNELPPPEELYPALGAVIAIRAGACEVLAEAVALGGRSERYLLNAAYAFLQLIGENGAAREELVRLSRTRDDPARERLVDLAALIPIVVDPDPNAATPRWERP